ARLKALLERVHPGGVVDLGQALIRALNEAASFVYALSRTDRRLLGMGTTATVGALVGNELVLGQVGDSRAYLARDGCLLQLTRDRTLAMLMIERGQLTLEEARHFEYANVILQAVGTQEVVDVDLRSVRVEDGDVLLLCSDGLSTVTGDEAIAAVLERAP